MKFAVIVLALIMGSCHALSHGGGRVRNLKEFKTMADGQLVGLLESLKDMMKEGIPSFNLPVLDPLSLPELAVNFTKEGLVDLDVFLTNVRSNGLSTYDVETGNFKLIGLKVDVALRWPEVSASFGYSGNGNLLDAVNLFGDGQIAFTVKDAVASLKMALAVRNKKLSVKDVDTKFSMKTLDFKITGLLNDEEISELITKIITEITPQLLDDYQEYVMVYVNEVITNLLNNYLGDMSLQDLLDLLG